MSTEEGRPLVAWRPQPIMQRSSSDLAQFRGILGIWPFPIINLLLALLQGAGSRAYPSYREPERRRRMSVWELSRDSEGRIREIIERELEDT